MSASRETDDGRKDKKESTKRDNSPPNYKCDKSRETNAGKRR